MPEEPINELPKGVKVIGIKNQPNEFSLPEGASLLNVKQPQGIDMTKFATTSEQDIEPIIEELARTSKLGSEGFEESKKEALRELLTNPNTTGEQAKRGIRILQGYDEKSSGKPLYYLKQEENGVIVPQALADGERPPAGYDVARDFGSKESSSDDMWTTDILKSVYNGAIGALESLPALGQQVSMLVSDEEVGFLNTLRNRLDEIKINKNEDLNASFLKTENIKEASDLFDADNYDISPKTIWGTVNMLTESVVSMLGPGKLAQTALKAGPKMAAFVGSYMSQLSDNLDANKSQGLDDREAAALTAFQTGAMATMDAIGLEPAVLYGAAGRKAKQELVKKLSSNIIRNADGTIAKESLKQMAKELPMEYAKLAKSGIKNYAVGVGIETTTEAAQEFLRRSAEQLWDKMSDEDKAKFGTDITSPESFAAYVENGLSGLIGGATMGAVANHKEAYDRTSNNAFNVVKKGPEAIKELKSNLAVAKDKGTLSENEYNQAIFKVDAYDKYNQQTTDTDLSDEQKKEAFELSFNIEALKSEIPTSKEDIDKLDPIAIAKINSKKELIKGLQKELDAIIQKEDAAKETKVGQETVNKVNKTMEPTEGQTTIDALRQKIQKLKPQPAEEIDIEAEQTELKPARRKIEDVPVNEWNDGNKTTSLQRKQIVQEALKTLPNNEIEAKLQEGQNQTMIVVMPDGRKLNLAQSVKSTDPKAESYIKRENFPSTKEEGVVDDAGRPMVSYKEPVAIKRVEVDARDLDTDKVITNEDGTPKRKAVLSVYNKQTGKHIGFVRELDPYKGRYVPSKYSPTEKAELNKITNANHLTDEISPYTYQPKQEKATGQPSTKKKANVETVGPSRQDTYTAPTEGDGTTDELSPREKAVLAAKKPELKLITVPKQSLKGKTVDITITNSAGEELTKSVDALKEQIAIEKELGLLEMLNKCIHG